MKHNSINFIVEEWKQELNLALKINDALFIAVFTIDKELIFANSSMLKLFNGETYQSLINPSFDKILSLKYDQPLIFEGFLTLGNHIERNVSIWAQMYRKEEKILIIGGINTSQLIEQNEIMFQLNDEVTSLQRALMLEKHTLEQTLSQLNNANIELAKLNNDKNKFISILGHDLRSPFNALIGFSDLLSENVSQFDNETIEDFAKTINHSAKNTLNLLDGLLDWVKSQSGKMPSNPQNVDFKLVCEEIVANFNLNLRKKKIAISIEGEDCILFADLEMIKTILRNLVSNAIKFSNQNGLITIINEQNATEVIISIVDYGVGMTAENVEKLFDVSQKITTEGTDNEIGTGLGLLLCKDFVEKHKGKIKVVSVVNQGTKFSFSIPKP
jgi:two-component system sensor histidine kinase/response regulator